MAMDLYKIISQLTEEEYEDMHAGFLANGAEKTASFFQIIRTNDRDPDKKFLEAYPKITPAAFYVLKSRLNQKVETYLLNRIGDPSLHVIHKVLNVSDLVYNNPREISVAALRKLEKELLKFDFPYGLMIVYKELQNQHSFDDNYTLYQSRYNQQVAHTVALDKARDLVIQFFRAYDSFHTIRKERDYQEMIRIMEKLDNLNNLYESHRLYIFKSIVHIFARLFIQIPETIRCEVEEIEQMFSKSVEILGEYKEDTQYRNFNILFNFLRFTHYEQTEVWDKSKIFFEILDYKIEEMVTRYHMNVNTSLFLFAKLRYHIRHQTVDQLVRDVDTYLSNLEVEPYRVSFYINYHMFLAYTNFIAQRYKKAARVLYNLRNEIQFRKLTHADLETKFFMALCYVMQEDFDLANSTILGLQRQLRKANMERYGFARPLLKTLTVALGGKPRTREKNLRLNIAKFKDGNVGRHALLKEVDLESLFLADEGGTTA